MYYTTKQRDRSLPTLEPPELRASVVFFILRQSFYHTGETEGEARVGGRTLPWKVLHLLRGGKFRKRRLSVGRPRSYFTPRFIPDGPSPGPGCPCDWTSYRWGPRETVKTVSYTRFDTTKERKLVEG